MREGVRRMDWEKVMEEQWGRAFVHESGHALMAVLKGIPCHGIYYSKAVQKFCAITDLPPISDYSHSHYLFLASSSAAERIIYGKEDEERANADRQPFSTEAYEILLNKKRQLKKLVSILKAKARQADLDMNALLETGMEGSDHKFAVLLPKQELENAVQSK